MANVVQGNSSGEYDLARSLHLYDTSGDLPSRSRELWQLIKDDARQLAREFWRRYAISPEVKEKLAVLGAEPMPMAPAEFDAFIRSETTRMAEIVKAAGIKGQ